MIYTLPVLGMLCILYFGSYYGWVRTWHPSRSAQTKASFSLEYKRAGCFSTTIAWLHTPLRKLDEKRYVRLYDLPEIEVPDFGTVPNLSALENNKRGE